MCFYLFIFFVLFLCEYKVTFAWPSCWQLISSPFLLMAHCVGRGQAGHHCELGANYVSFLNIMYICLAYLVEVSHTWKTVQKQVSELVFVERCGTNTMLRPVVLLQIREFLDF